MVTGRILRGCVFAPLVVLITPLGMVPIYGRTEVWFHEGRGIAVGPAGGCRGRLAHVTAFYTLLCYGDTFYTRLIRCSRAFLVKRGTSGVSLDQCDRNGPTVPNVCSIDICIGSRPVVGRDVAFVRVRKGGGTRTYVALGGLLRFRVGSPSVGGRGTILLTESRALNGYLGLARVVPRTSIHCSIGRRHLSVSIPRT